MKDTQEDIVKAYLQPADPELDDEPEDDDTDTLRRGFKDVGTENNGRIEVLDKGLTGEEDLKKTKGMKNGYES